MITSFAGLIRTSLAKTVARNHLHIRQRLHRNPTILQTRAMAIAADKRQVRSTVNKALKDLSEDTMARESTSIAQRVIQLPLFQSARQLAIYVHCARLREVDTTQILDNAMTHTGARIYVPRVQDSDSNMHFLHLDSLKVLKPVPPFGILEPPPTYDDGSLREDVLDTDTALDLIVMPGLAFNRKGQRLGRGGGYYDKFIESCRKKALAQGDDPPLLIALAYQAQMIDDVPVEDNDMDVDVIVTCDEVVACTERGRAAVE